MPAGITWSSYISHLGAAMLAMFLGAQTVYSIYRPLDNLDELVQEELQKLKEERAKNAGK